MFLAAHHMVSRISNLEFQIFTNISTNQNESCLLTFYLFSSKQSDGSKNSLKFWVCYWKFVKPCGGEAAAQKMWNWKFLTWMISFFARKPIASATWELQQISSRLDCFCNLIRNSTSFSCKNLWIDPKWQNSNSK